MNLQEMQEAINAMNDIVGYETDTSCGDPECCGGPYYEREDYEAAILFLRRFGIEYEP